ncbi:VOC family protein [Parasphingorhabdus pacifica]
MASSQPIPEDAQRVTPYLHVHDAQAAILFYSTVLGATERMRMPTPDGKIAHAEIQIGNSTIMLADEFDEHTRGPKSIGGSPVVLYVYVEDVDNVYDRAMQEGATSTSPVEDQFYGDRSGQFEDPFGHRWNVATHVEDVSSDEVFRRASEMMGS